MASDPFLDGLIMPGEVASVSVAHRAFELVPDVPVPAHGAARGDLARIGRALPAPGRAGDLAGRAAAPRPGGRRLRRAADRALGPDGRRVGAAAARGHAPAAAARALPLRRGLLPARAELHARAARRRARTARGQGLRRRHDGQLRSAARAGRHAGRRARRARRRGRGGDPRAVDPGRAAGVRAPLPVRAASRTGWATPRRPSGRRPSAPSPPIRSGSPSWRTASRSSTWTRPRS